MKNKNIDWNKLVLDSLANNQEAIEALYNATYPQGFAVAMQMLNNEQDAMDVMQDAYVSAFNNLQNLKDGSKFKSWFNCIVANRCRDYLRKHKDIIFTDVEIDADVEFEDTLESDSIEFSPEESIDYSETKRLLAEILQALPEEQKLCILMFYYNELSIKEIAETLECSESTVKSRLNYARKKIKEDVKALEKKGTKLYGIAPIPFIVWMLRSMENESIKTSVVQVWTAISSTTLTTANASVATTGIGTAIGISASKIGLTIIGIIAAAVIGGGAIAVNVSNNTQNASVPISQTKDTMHVELGEEFHLKASDFLNVAEDLEEQVQLDTSRVDISIVGEYEATATYENDTFVLTVLVVDTTPPEVSFKSRVYFDNNIEEFSGMDVLESASDPSGYEEKIVGYEYIADVSEADDEYVANLVSNIQTPPSLESLDSEIPTTDGIYRVVFEFADVYDNSIFEEVFVIFQKEDVIEKPTSDTTSKEQTNTTQNNTNNNSTSSEAVDNSIHSADNPLCPNECGHSEIEEPEGLTPTQKAVIEAGYYNVIIAPSEAYAVMVKNADECFSVGVPLLEEYLDNIGCEMIGSIGGGWINPDAEQYLVYIAKSNVGEKVDLEDETVWLE